ncbi:hypothetical protein AVEN_130279-1 [Araneus ventricosus]|uniref:Tc1-like transposase DDE domain-containing protein n=1 Tax=Araneus ventricosus TaxID=182803 RepID=A0A4Y2X420_ARAVE|nr:hypothetical protein AVEN_60770-1 [Araneus ventricosus]GBO43928.1 hypothetical protein AVEN_130279-1 [Araneus ventricosus]
MNLFDGQMDEENILKSSVSLHARATSDMFILMDDKARYHRSRLVGTWLLEQGIERLGVAYMSTRHESNGACIEHSMETVCSSARFPFITPELEIARLEKWERVLQNLHENFINSRQT